MIRASVQRSTNRTFLRSFLVILIAQALTILIAWWSLDFNIRAWLNTRTTSLTRISQQAASVANWTQIDKIPKDRDSRLGDEYQDRLDKLSNRYFVGKEGSVFLTFVERGEEYDIYSGNYIPVQDAGKANRWLRDAYRTRRTTYSPSPIVDDTGTYLAAYTPILHGDEVVGVVAAEYDEAPLSSFQSIVGRAFWFSIVPAVLLISLVVAYVVAARYVDPMDMFRAIAETAHSKSEVKASERETDPWTLLTTRQRQVAALVKEAKSNKEIADALSLSAETVKQHLKDIKARTGLGRVELAILAAARTSSPPAAAT